LSGAKDLLFITAAPKRVPYPIALFAMEPALSEVEGGKDEPPSPALAISFAPNPETYSSIQ
jgi:hypothetical protein